MRIIKYEDALDLLGVKITEENISKLKYLEKEGYTEKGICYGICRSQIKIMSYRGDKRFWNILYNEVRKWTWKKSDPRWLDYWKQRKEAEQAKKIRKEIAKTSQLTQKANVKKYKGFIYFVQGESGGAIKIGYAKDVISRIKVLQTGYPDKLKILKTIPGNEAKEALIHDELAAFRLNGEWFRPDDYVIEKNKRIQIII